jgi:hypothetical protein
MKFCKCPRAYRRNPNSLDFVIDYFRMLDALKGMNAAIAQAGWGLPPEYQELNDRLERAGPQIQALEFSQIFAATIAPTGEEPSHTKIYRMILAAKQNPADPVNHAILEFVEKLKRIIQTFDFAKARDTQQLTFVLMEMRRFVNDMLQEIHSQPLNLDSEGLDALQNMERWKSSMGILDPHRLSLSKLNEFIRVLQPTQPFGLSVYHIYRHIDPADAQSKAMEFMSIISQISNLINPFTQELAANDELTGWKYLHVPVP